jgi:SulP family sulfate permease
LLYAGSRTLQARLPGPAAARSPVVVLRLRGRTTLGATFIKIVTDYADRLGAADGSGPQPDLIERLRRTGSVQGPLRGVEAPRRR